MAWPKQERGRPSCPCGFVGGTRNIIAHRLACPEWKKMTAEYLEHLQKEQLRLELDKMVERGEIKRTPDGKYYL